MRTAVIIVAAGDGVRMGAGTPKALIPLAGRPLVCWSLATFAAHPGISERIVVGPPGRLAEMSAAVASVDPDARVVPGGATRAQSVGAGLVALSDGIDRVLVHDAARPLVASALIDDVVAALNGAPGAVAAHRVADTLKRASADFTIEATVDRSSLWAAETPQGFHLAALRAAYGHLSDAEIAAATDCASIVQAAGGRVVIVPSGAANLKVTTPADADIAALILMGRSR